jgi:hypothetical protein
VRGGGADGTRPAGSGRGSTAGRVGAESSGGPGDPRRERPRPAPRPPAPGNLREGLGGGRHEEGAPSTPTPRGPRPFAGPLPTQPCPPSAARSSHETAAAGVLAHVVARVGDAPACDRAWQQRPQGLRDLLVGLRNKQNGQVDSCRPVGRTSTDARCGWAEAGRLFGSGLGGGRHRWAAVRGGGQPERPPPLQQPAATPATASAEAPQHPSPPRAAGRRGPRRAAADPRSLGGCEKHRAASMRCSRLPGETTVGAKQGASEPLGMPGAGPPGQRPKRHWQEA